MAFVSALRTDLIPFNPAPAGPGLFPQDSLALARLGGVSALPGGYPPGAARSQMPMMQLQLEMMTMLLQLMLSGPGGRAERTGVRPVGGGSALGGGTPPAPPSQPGGKSSFNIASFNVLGASHTAAGGNKPQLGSGEDRMRGAVQAMQRNHVDIAGLQEFQGSQQGAFRKLAPGYAMAAEDDNAVVWNKDKFRLVERRTVAIPYFEGHPRKMPVVQLEDKATGKRMWVINIHNPADTKDHPRNAANRARAVQREQELVRELQATGVPVFIVGDFNEGKEVSGDMAQAGMKASAPRGARTGIDWVFGSSGVQFSNYALDRSPVASGSSDHPLVVSTATI